MSTSRRDLDMLTALANAADSLDDFRTFHRALHDNDCEVCSGIVTALETIDTVRRAFLRESASR